MSECGQPSGKRSKRHRESCRGCSGRRSAERVEKTEGCFLKIASIYGNQYTTLDGRFGQCVNKSITTCSLGIMEGNDRRALGCPNELDSHLETIVSREKQSHSLEVVVTMTASKSEGGE